MSRNNDLIADLVNHDAVAIELHAANHKPTTWDSSPPEESNAGVVVISPNCKHFSGTKS